MKKPIIIVISISLVIFMITAVPSVNSQQTIKMTECVDVIKLMLDQANKIRELETRIAVLEKCGGKCEYGFPAPDYDSGWRPIKKNQHLILEHNLNTMDYLVYVIKNDKSPTEFHNFGQGGFHVLDLVIDYDAHKGTMWTASENSIDIYRYDGDITSNFVRVILWKIPQYEQ